MTELADLLNELTEAQQDVKRTERAYSVCLLTDSLCRDEQKKYQRAVKRLHEIERKIHKSRANHGYTNDN